MLPVVSVQSLVELARAYLLLVDAAGAEAVLDQASAIVQQRPDLGTLPDEVARLRQTALQSSGVAAGASSLTTAELRLLPLLPTHLTLREIGERLHLSRHTVKSQAVSLYRKLGVSSRSEAVARIDTLGLHA
jgi:LuxR family maltose regulon positive regulatory protein